MASRVGVFVATTYACWVLTGPMGVFVGTSADATPSQSPIEIWNQWDVHWYQSIATSGYGAPGFENSGAFLPGLPALLSLGSHAGLPLTLTGLLISLIAGAYAAWALGELTHTMGGESSYGVLAWVLAPMAVFLAAPYTEALFCAFAFPAWLQAKRGRWVWAGVLAAFAACVRVNGVFLAAALIVMFLASRPRRWLPGSALLLALLPLGGYLLFLHERTGSWTAWFEFQAAGWDRHFTQPLEALGATYALGFTDGVAASFAVKYRFEIAAMFALLALAVVMLAKRWWGEAAFVLLTCVSLATSSQWYSVPRAALTLAPVWVLLGIWMSRHRWLRIGYVAVAAPMMIVGAVAFTQGRWVA